MFGPSPPFFRLFVSFSVMNFGCGEKERKYSNLPLAAILGPNNLALLTFHSITVRHGNIVKIDSCNKNFQPTII